jgi:hypothetical protein
MSRPYANTYPRFVQEATAVKSFYDKIEVCCSILDRFQFTFALKEQTKRHRRTQEANRRGRTRRPHKNNRSRLPRNAQFAVNVHGSHHVIFAQRQEREQARFSRCGSCTLKLCRKTLMRSPTQIHLIAALNLFLLFMSDHGH